MTITTATADTTINDAYQVAPLSEHERSRVRARLMSLGLDQLEAARALKEREESAESAAVLVADRVVLGRLRKFGSEPGPKQVEALHQIHTRYAALASGRESGRWAFPLDLGCGKTQSIVAFIIAIDALELPWTVAVSSLKVEANCSLQRQLIEGGVAEGEIAQRHGKKHSESRVESARRHEDREYASEPAVSLAAAQGRKYLLATHERFRRLKDKGLAEIEYMGEPRGLVVWDEAFLSSEGRTVSAVQLRETQVALQSRLEEMSEEAISKVHRRAVAWVGRVTALVTRVLKQEQKAEECGKPRQAAATRQLPALNGMGPEEFVEVCSEVMKSNPTRDGSHMDTVKALADIAGLKVRIGKFGGKAAVLAYQVQVPDEVNRVVVLDGSFPIRMLTNLDSSIRTLRGFDGKVKNYQAVTLHHWNQPSGRSAITAEMRKKHDKQATTWECVEVQQKQVGPGEAALFFTFKPEERSKGRSPAANLQAMMKRHDINPDEMLEVGVGEGRVEMKPRWPVLTWGNETSLSDYAYCQHVIFYGVLYRNRHDLAASLLGTLRNPAAALSKGTVNELIQSELAHVIYQASGRGSCREIRNGKAGAADIWLPLHNEKVVKTLRATMPQLQVTAWAPVHHRQSNPGRGRGLVEEIMNALPQLPAEMDHITINQFKRANGWTSENQRAFGRALTKALDDSWACGGWARSTSRRSLVRRLATVPSGIED